LPDQLSRALAAGHPWIYREHVPAAFSAPSGTWAQVRCAGFVAYALWDARSPIALRVFSTQRVPDAEWMRERVRDALALRSSSFDGNTSAYRLLNGEGDGVPGLVVDVYGSFAVIATSADALDVLVPWVVAALSELLHPQGILRRLRASDAREPHVELLAGRAPPRDLVVSEYGVRLYVDVFAGQKTGLYLDHRENRRFLAAHCQGKRVLNLFAYTGAFSLHAALAGAKSVTSVDAAEPALTAARANFELNGLDPDGHEFIADDVFKFLERARNEQRRYELVICDPPSFANSRAQLKSALRAYVGVTSAALRVTELGGLYAAASCTAQVSPEAFRGVLSESACNAKRRLQILHDAGHAADHPVAAGHPEGRYLKFMLGRVLGLS
jgi:23S rRNA (cytosine1962-C5)-methyltransferase